jgi:molecular chaperone DnaK
LSTVTKGTGKKQSIRIEGSSNLDDLEIERMKREAEENADADKKIKEETDTLNEADGMIFNTEKQMKEFEDKFEGTEKEELEKLTTEFYRLREECKENSRHSAIFKDKRKKNWKE